MIKFCKKMCDIGQSQMGMCGDGFTTFTQDEIKAHQKWASGEGRSYLLRIERERATVYEPDPEPEPKISLFRKIINIVSTISDIVSTISDSITNFIKKIIKIYIYFKFIRYF